MGIRRTQAGTAENTVVSAVLIVVIVIVVASIMWPVFARTGGHGRKDACQNNLKELTTALILYEQDYDGLLPSSALKGNTTWDAGNFKRFATEHGDWSRTKGGAPTCCSLLNPYIKNKEVIWCPGRKRTFLLWELVPSQDVASDSPNAIISYWYKAAVDRAWFGDSDANGKWVCRKEADFGFPADVIVFYEHLSRHWGDEKMGLADGVTLNCGYLDGHVAVKRLKDAGNPVGKTDPTALGEPAWFNHDFKSGKALGKGRFFDGRTCGDNLP